MFAKRGSAIPLREDTKALSPFVYKAIYFGDGATSLGAFILMRENEYSL